MCRAIHAFLLGIEGLASLPSLRLWRIFRRIRPGATGRPELLLLEARQLPVEAAEHVLATVLAVQIGFLTSDAPL
jgi:hypothetical protein